jgi:sugar/nucleoside kinase (ribokinase family)
MPSQPFDVVGLGENSVDHVYRLQDTLAPNTKLTASTHRVLCGGQVATALATCAALGLRTAYVGAFGNDPNGGRMRDALVTHHVDTTHALVRDCPSRHAVILVDEGTGHRTVVAVRDPRLDLGGADVPRDLLAGARVLHVDDTDPAAALAAARIAREAGIAVTCDIDRVAAHTRELLALVTTPIWAEHVPATLTGELDVERALRRLRRGHSGLLCVTLGARGAALLDGDQFHQAPAPHVEVVDTTGAGDVFRGAFIYALLQGEAPADILRFAVAAAALSCTQEGALDSVPALEQVRRLLAL